MAAPNMSLISAGLADGTGTADALFLKVFAGEVLTAFAENNVMMSRHMVRTITSGKSASFPATWKTAAGYHTPGNMIIGAQSVKHNERIITVDDLLISDVFVGNLDEAKNHYDYRSIYSTQVGEALSRTWDKNVLQAAVLAARATTTVTGGFGGSAVFNTSAHTDSDILGGLIFDAAQAFDEKDVPANERQVGLRPAQYYLMAQNTKYMNRDWGGAGSLATASIPMIADMEVVKTNNLPITNLSEVTGTKNTYHGDFSDTIGVCWHKGAVGTVKLMDLTTQMTGSEFAVVWQGTLIVGKYAVGHGILRPECAVELRKAAP